MGSNVNQNEASPPLRAASWEAERDGVMCKPERGFHVPWGCELRNCHHVRRLLGGPKEWRHTQTKQNEASPSLGAANYETVAMFVGPWGVQRSGVIRGSEFSLAASGGCELRSCRQIRWLLGGPTEWGHTQIRMRPRLPGSGCELRKCRHVRGLLGDRAAWCYTQIRMRPRRPLGAEHSKTVATFVVCWRVQLSDLIRRSEPGLAAPGSCDMRNCRHLRSLLGAHRRDVLRRSE